MVIGKEYTQFADLAYASPAAIIRLCRKLGCTGIPRFPACTLVYENALFKDSRGDICSGDHPMNHDRRTLFKVTRKTSSLLRRQKLVEPELLTPALK